MVTPKTCRLCRLCPEDALEHFPICASHWPEFCRSGEGRRMDGIMSEEGAEKVSRIQTAALDFITRVLAEREVERGRT